MVEFGCAHYQRAQLPHRSPRRPGTTTTHGHGRATRHPHLPRDENARSGSCYDVAMARHAHSRDGPNFIWHQPFNPRQDVEPGRGAAGAAERFTPFNPVLIAASEIVARSRCGGSAAFLAAASERGNAMPEPRSNRGNGAQAASYYENPEPTYPPPWPLRRFLYVWEPVSPDGSHPGKPASPAAYPGTGFLRGKYFLSANADRRGDLTPGNSRGDRRPDVTGEHIGCHNRGRSRCGRRADRRTANGVEIHAVIACL
jgi:hypothetical protein